MKKIIGSILALTLFTFSVNAQNDQTQSNGQYGKHTGRGDMGMQKLNLTETQKQQVKIINEDFRNKMKSLKNNAAGADAGAQRQALVQERNNKISAILTNEQRAIFDQLHESNAGFNNRGAAGDNENDHKAKMKKMQSELGLTDDQMARIKANNQTFKPRMEAIKNNATLSADQKKAQMKALNEERTASMKTILTAEQQAKFDQMKGKKGGDFKHKQKGANGKQKTKIKTT